MRVDAVVLGGGDAGALGASVPYKGALPVAGRSMVEWVVDALRVSACVRYVAVVVPSATGIGPWADRVEKIVIHDDGPVANLLAGVDSFGYEHRILALAADLPLVSAESIDGFMEACGDLRHDFYYPVIERTEAEAAYEGVRRTYMRLREGTYTGGNLVVLNPHALRANRVLAERAFEARKSPVGLARILGVRFVLRLVTRRLTIRAMEEKVGRLIGGSAKAVPTTLVDLAMDVDKPSDLEIVERVIRGRSAD